jgi:hypothetical protein
MRNLRIIASTDVGAITTQLPDRAHFTNGTYALAAKLIVPTTITGFGHVNSLEQLPMVIAINSDVSMASLNITCPESQELRARKVAEPLAKAFPGNDVYVVFYDEKTPFTLYQALHAAGKTTTLHKWGYGTVPDAPKIEGAEFFDRVYAYPLPNDQKPVCYEITAKPDTHQDITVVDLRESFQAPKPSCAARLRRSLYNNRYSLLVAAAAVTSAAIAYAVYSEDTSNLDDLAPKL